MLADRLQEHAVELGDRLLRAARSEDDAVAVRAIQSWAKLVYGRSLERSEDEQPDTVGALDVARMTREERLRPVDRVSRDHPELAAQVLGPRPVDETDESTPPTS